MFADTILLSTLYGFASAKTGATGSGTRQTLCVGSR